MHRSCKHMLCTTVHVFGFIISFLFHMKGFVHCSGKLECISIYLCVCRADLSCYRLVMTLLLLLFISAFLVLDLVLIVHSLGFTVG